MKGVKDFEGCRRIVFTIVCLLATSSIGWGQKVVSGTILDAGNAQPIINATVVFQKDTARTDTAGNFYLKVNDSASSVIISATGYVGKVWPLKTNYNRDLDILLEKDSTNLATSTNDTSVFRGVFHVVNGIVLDGKSKESIPGVSFYMKEEGEGTASDMDGTFQLLFTSDSQSVEISGLGYDVLDTVIVGNLVKDTIIIFLKPYATDLDEVTIVARKKGRYRNKNNPAVALVKRVIANKAQNRMEATQRLQFKFYDKMVLSITNFPKMLIPKFIMKKIGFIFENIDTTRLPGRKVMPLFVSEKFATQFREGTKAATKLEAEKRIKFDGDLVESNNIASFLDRLYDKVDIYDNTVRILDNFFLSPISDVAPNFYRFYIVDTVVKNGDKIVQLQFEPRNEKDFVFEGRMTVNLSNYAVTRVFLTIPKGINLNWTKQLTISLGFEQQPNGRYLQDESQYFVDFGLFKGKQGVIGDRYIKKFDFDSLSTIPDSVFVVKDVKLESENDTLFDRPESFWVANRPVPLSIYEERAYRNIDSLRNMQFFKDMMKVAYTMATGYINLNKVEVGSIYDVYSYNPVEGVKLKLGLRTNIKKWDKFLLQGYGAYGFLDQKFKYYLSGTFSLKDNYVFGFPMHYLRLNYMYDVRPPGAALGISNSDNIFNNAKRGDQSRLMYHRLFELLYLKEFQGNLTTTLGYNWWQQTPAGTLYYVRADGGNDTVKNILTNEIKVGLRWAPGERFYQNKRFRTKVENNTYTFTLNAAFGWNTGLLSKPIPYQHYELGITKKYNLAPLGFAFVQLNAGYLHGTVPYPLLYIPQTNQSFFYSTSAFNLMNNLEFVYDKYASLNIDYHMRGFILNKIPLIKQFYLREVFGLRMLYGGIRNNNLPTFNHRLLKFPTDSAGAQIVNFLGSTPYIEASIGVENIAKIFRVDFIRRFTYLNLPNAPKYGIKFSFGFGY